MENGDYVAPMRGRKSLQRTVAVGAAVVMAAGAVILVVFADSQKQVQIGVLLGLWAGLIAAFVAFGSRRTLAEVDAVRESLESQVAELRETQITLAQVQTQQASQTIELRQRVEEARISEIVDPSVLRQELNRLLTEQIGSLRDEIAGLRAEMVDKLGNELRLERIETTRLVGSDLEALQREVRKLTTNPGRTIEAPQTVTEQVYVEAVEPEVLETEVIEPVRVEPVRVEPEVVEPEVVEPVAVEPEVVVPPVVKPAPEPQNQPDVFAGLPRLGRVSDELAELLLHDDEPEVVEVPIEATAEATDKPAEVPAVQPSEKPEADRPYVGRRRAAADTADDEADGSTESTPSSSGGGRRRAPAQPEPYRRPLRR